MRETPTQQPPPGTPNESWCWGGSSRSIPRVPWTTNGGTSMGMSGGIRAGSPLPSVRNQRKNQPLPLPATRIWGFFPSFPFLLPPPPPFVSLFLSKDTRSCSNLFSWPNPAGLSSAGCVCKEKIPPPKPTEPGGGGSISFGTGRRRVTCVPSSQHRGSVVKHPRMRLERDGAGAPEGGERGGLHP